MEKDKQQGKTGVLWALVPVLLLIGFDLFRSDMIQAVNSLGFNVLFGGLSCVYFVAVLIYLPVRVVLAWRRRSGWVAMVVPIASLLLLFLYIWFIYASATYIDLSIRLHQERREAVVARYVAGDLEPCGVTPSSAGNRFGPTNGCV